MRAPRVLALGLLLASAAASADLCDGPCSVTMDFASGGSIATTDGATITFSAGGVLELGTGGSITLGTDGALTPNVDPPDMSGGGTLVLGAGGSVTFGTGGMLDTGTAGNVSLAEGSDLDVGAAGVTIDAAQAVHAGDLTAGGTISLTAGGAITAGDTSSPIHFDTSGGITVTSDTAVTYGTATATTVDLNPNTAPNDGAGFGDCSSGCPGGTGTIGSPNIPVEGNTLSSPASGGPTGLFSLLPLLLLGLLRRR